MGEPSGFLTLWPGPTSEAIYHITAEHVLHVLCTSLHVPSCDNLRSDCRQYFSVGQIKPCSGQLELLL